MTRVENIITAVGEDDGPALSPPLLPKAENFSSIADLPHSRIVSLETCRRSALLR